jgi:hypothetical protein
MSVKAILTRLWHPIPTFFVGIVVGFLIGSRAVWYDLCTKLLALPPSRGFFRWTQFAPVVVVDALATLIFVLLVINASKRDIGKAIPTTDTSLADQSRTNYLDSLKTMVTAAGVAIAIVAAGVQKKFPVEPWILRRAAVSLTMCIGVAVLTMFMMSQAYDKARVAKKTLTWSQLIPLLLLASVALFTFFLGFSYLARLTFHIE